jgi:Zn-dependent M28 family amino/carboxypeptidase
VAVRDAGEWVPTVGVMKRIAALTVVLSLSAAPAIASDHPKPMGDYALKVIKDLTSEQRVQGTPGEVRAGNKIRAWFKDSGLKTSVQKFSYTRRGVTSKSRNIVATIPGKTKKTIIIGAHYDNRPEGEGADDNASGVSVMVEVAKRLAKQKPMQYTIKFVAFGAEENPAGLVGSNTFVKRMSPKQVKNAQVMINYDSLIVGDHMYVHAGANEKVWARDMMLSLAERYRLPLQVQPGWNPAYPAGIIPNQFSDYTAFNKAGIPIVAFESTNWEIADKDGYTQTEQNGSYWHTPKDTLEKIMQDFPHRPGVRLYVFTKVTMEFLKSVR